MDGTRHKARTTVERGWRKARGPHHPEERMAQGTRSTVEERAFQARVTVRNE